MLEHAEHLLRIKARIATLERCVAAHLEKGGILGRADATALEQMLRRTLDALRARQQELGH